MGNILPYVLAGFAVAGSLGGIAGYFAQSRAKTVIELLSTENQTLSGKCDRLEKDNLALAAANEAFKISNQHLKEIAQQTPEIRKLTSKITDVAVTLATLAKSLGVKK